MHVTRSGTVAVHHNADFSGPVYMYAVDQESQWDLYDRGTPPPGMRTCEIPDGRALLSGDIRPVLPCVLTSRELCIAVAASVRRNMCDQMIAAVEDMA